MQYIIYTYVSILNHVPRSVLAVEEVVTTAVLSTSTLEGVVVTDVYVSPIWIEHRIHTLHTHVHKHFKSSTRVHAFFYCGGIRLHFVYIDSSRYQDILQIVLYSEEVMYSSSVIACVSSDYYCISCNALNLSPTIYSHLFVWLRLQKCNYFGRLFTFQQVNFSWFFQ